MREIIIILFFLLNGCIVRTYEINKEKPLDRESCKNVPKVWWGEKGNDPSDNEVWLCNPWILKAQEEE
jgi:hypothetical protein